MSTAITSKSVPLASIFDPYVTGTTKARAAGIDDAGTDTSDLYANIIYGTAAAATGIKSENADLNTLYAAKGTAQYKTPDNGTPYASTRTVAVGGSGIASVALLATRTQYEVIVATNSGSTTYGPFSIPAGMTQFYTGVLQTSSPDSHYSQSVLYDKVWTNLTTLSPSTFTQLAFAEITVTSAVSGQTVQGTATLTLDFGTSSSPIFTGTNGWTMTVRNTA